MSMPSTFRIIVFSCILLLYGCGDSHHTNSSSTKISGSIHYEYFINPPEEFRSHPFYSINDSLTESEISRQITDFKQAGIGGFYLHSRSGLITEFLGDDWWKIMEASVKAANTVGLHCMFYDEDKWPSGYAGGIIPSKSEDFRSKCLARLNRNTPLPKGAEIIQSDSSYNYVMYTMQFGWDIFNGTCYVDLFNPEAVQFFIDVSYKPYIEKYKSKIKTYTPAIFSDEPHVHARYFDKNTPQLGTLSYSPWLEKKFQDLYRYSLRENLPLLFEEKENWREVRLHYYRAKALAFEESYTKQLAGYCGDHGFDYTGHYLAEDVMQKIRDRAANTMLHYRSMQRPGIDMLGLSIDNKLITAKNLSSVANQYKKEKRLSELFGISGQNMNFEDRKWLAGWHSITGINHFCPHLTLYSMKGHRKRDYPPTFSYQQPYWTYNKKLEDYLGRIAYAASVGKYDPQILVISPLESEYIKGSKDGEFTTGMLAVLESLQSTHYDYDIGDEQILADTAFIANNRLQVGAMRYQHVILPDMISIRESTVDLLLALYTKGGLVINTGRFPNFMDGKENPLKLEELKNLTISTSIHDLNRSLVDNIEPKNILSGRKSEKIWTQTRTIKEGKLVQFYNSSHTETIRFDYKTNNGETPLILWDPSEANCYTLPINDQDVCTIELAPSSNIWISSGINLKEEYIKGEYKLPPVYRPEFNLDDSWKGNRLSPNAITLDLAQYSIDKGNTFSLLEPVIGIFNRLSDQDYKGELLLKYPVKVDVIPEKCELVLEQVELYNEIAMNGKQLQFSGDGFYIDHTFIKVDVTDFIIDGQNYIELKLTFKAPQTLSPDPKERYGTEIESIYLCGDFAVTGTDYKESYDTQRNRSGNFQERPIHKFSSFHISAEKEIFEGNLCLEGYPFFAGSFELSQHFNIPALDPEKRYYLELPDCETIASVVEINGNITDTLVWSPYRTEITDFLHEGQNSVKITLVNSLRNLLGPHHHKGGELIKVGPKSFTGLGGFPDGRGEKDWYEIRKTGTSNAIWTDTYMHIPFGFLEAPIITSSIEK